MPRGPDPDQGEKPKEVTWTPNEAPSLDDSDLEIVSIALGRNRGHDHGHGHGHGLD